MANSKTKNTRCYVDWEEYFRLKNEEELDDKKIAKIFLMSKNTLRRLKKENNIETSKNIITVDWDRYDELKKQGYTDKQAAQVLDIHPATLSQKKKQRKVG